jgi:tetratricopeptide (TPR) repeat protein
VGELVVVPTHPNRTEEIMKAANHLLVAALAAGVLGTAAPVVAQSGDEHEAARDSLAACIQAGEAGHKPEALAAAEAASSGLDAWHEASPDDPEPLVAQARVLLQCRLPFAEFMEQGALSARASEILRSALELDPSHWEGRYLLAINYFHNPEFMGLTDDAIREFETLLEQQGERTDFPEMAGPYVYLGDLYVRVERPDDARATWERGARLFPDDPRLGERLAPDAAADTPDPDSPAPGSMSDSTTARRIDHEMEPLVATVEGGYAMDDARRRASLNRLDVYMAPGGTADILQVFQMLPGATRASEGSDLYVRGGDPAETPVMVEGARLLYAGVFETLHGGVFGILDPSVLRRAYFSSGGFSARWGDALSGVVDLETDGAPGTVQARGGLNFAGGGATVRAPIGGRGGLWGSLRATETSLLNVLHGDAGEYPSAPRSLEGVAGATFAPRPGLELKAVALAEGDDAAREIDAIGWNGPFESRGRTSLAVVSLRALTPDAGRAFRATASWTRRASDFEFGVLDRERIDRRAALRVEGDIGSGASRQLRFGVEAAHLDAVESGRVPTTERVAPGSPAEPLAGGRDASAHAGAFVEAEVHPVSALALVAGTRVDRLPGEESMTLDPRLAIAWRADDWTFRVAGGTFQQGRWRVDYELPDGGVPAGTPRRARHAALGIEREGRPSLRVEGFLKSYDRYAPEDGELEIESGRAAGIDALARWLQTDRWGGWVAYSYLHASLDLADGLRVPSGIDVTHSLTAVATRTIGAWQIGATARYATGRPYTPVVGSSDTQGFPAPVYGEAHSRRLPDYARLDARLTRFQSLGGRMAVFYLEVLNVLDRDNAATVVYDSDWKNPRTLGSIFADRTLVAGVELQLR